MISPAELSPPPAYVARIERMAKDLREALEGGQVLRFVMPPKEIMVVGVLADVGQRFAQSEDARRLVAKFVKDAPAELCPTVLMLRCALHHAGIACETVSLGALGLGLGGGAPS